MSGSLRILGVRIDSLLEDEVLQQVQRFVESGTPHHIVTVNPEFIVLAQDDPCFKEILEEADLALPDGVGLLWAARFLGRPLRARVTGVDTLRRLAGLAAERGYGIFLLGASDGIAEAAGRVLQKEHSRLRVVGTYAGSPDVQEEETVARIRAAAPHMIFVAYGAPHQEKWIRRNMHRMNVPVAMGVGGAFDFISGAVQRAPLWMQRLGLEWLHRLAREPWRWRRMLRLPRFMLLLLAQSRRG